MADVVVTLGLKEPWEEQILANAIDTFARWRETVCASEAGDRLIEAPEIMVKTALGEDGAVRKQIIFQDRRWAAAFLHIWRNHKRRQN